MTDVSNLTRRKLYDLVWQKPVDALAKEFGISGRGLGKICERHGIPVPPRGYWARKAAGQKVIKPPLVEVGSDRPSDIGIRLPSLSDYLRNERDEAKACLNMWREQIEQVGSIAVPEKLMRPHTIIARWLAADETARKRSHENQLHGKGKSVSRYEAPLAQRRLRIIDTLIKHLEYCGFEVMQDTQGSADLIVKRNADDVSFWLGEWIREYRRQITPEEAAQLWNKDQKWCQERQETGLLELRITSPLPKGIPERWRELDHTIDEKLPEIVAAFIVSIAYSERRRMQREENERRQFEIRQQAQKLEEERKKEAALREALRSAASAWKKATDLRAFVAAVVRSVSEGGSYVDASKLPDWTAWALKVADEIDPLHAANQ